MTADQQLRSLGVSAMAYEGHILIEMDRPFMTFTPEEIRRFYVWLDAAYRDALGRDRRRTPDLMRRAG